MTQCSSCSAALASDAAFCSRCGTAAPKPGLSTATMTPPMAACAACGTPLRIGAAFCPSCGRSTTPQARAMINPEAERAVRAATQSAKTAVASLGAEKMLALIGGLLGLLGSVLPYYAAGYAIPGFAATSSTSLFHIGTEGAIVLVLAIVLGLAPMALIFSRSTALIGFGLSAAVLGEIVLGYMAMPSYGFGWYGIGFYCALIGFAILAYVYARRVLA